MSKKLLLIIVFIYRTCHLVECTKRNVGFNYTVIGCICEPEYCTVESCNVTVVEHYNMLVNISANFRKSFKHNVKVRFAKYELPWNTTRTLYRTAFDYTIDLCELLNGVLVNYFVRPHLMAINKISNLFDDCPYTEKRYFINGLLTESGSNIRAHAFARYKQTIVIKDGEKVAIKYFGKYNVYPLK